MQWIPAPGVIGASLTSSTAQANATIMLNLSESPTYTTVSSSTYAPSVKEDGINFPKGRNSTKEPNLMWINSTHNKKDRQGQLKEKANADLIRGIKYLVAQNAPGTHAVNWSEIEARLSGLVQENREYPKYVGFNTFLINKDGETIKDVHYHDKCEGQGCPIHHPSNHPLKNAHMTWRNGHILRVCEHGVAHWDADDIAYRQRTSGRGQAYHCGCLCNCCGLKVTIDRV